MKLINSMFSCFILLTIMHQHLAAQKDLSGVYEISSMGADRRMEVWQQGDKIIAYRVMWPEFEGEKYKLEQYYRGRIDHGTITGDMLVREEGMASFDFLRPFDGRIDTKGKLTLDGLLLLLQQEKLTNKPPQLKPKKKRRRRRALFYSTQPAKAEVTL